MSPRNKEENQRVRESRRLQILEAALTTYVRLGYNGTDMDSVAVQAGLAKGLVYYYYKTKQEVFRAMFQWALDRIAEESRAFIESHLDQSPVKRLIHYIYDIFMLTHRDPRFIQFAMRLPFDAYAVFGSVKWREGMEKSFLHQKSMASMIQAGINEGEISPVDALHAANCFWAVFVANLFNFSRMIGAFSEREEEQKQSDHLSQIKSITLFCFQGLGIDKEIWSGYLEKIIDEGSNSDEGI